MLRDFIESDNIIPDLDPDIVSRIGRDAVRDYEDDLASREEWEQVMDKALDLAMQLVEEKSWPWEKASNVKFPLLTLAAMQFNARAMPALIPSQSIVRCRVLGDDPDGSKRARADRVGAHMSWQLLEQDEGWEEGHDRLLMALPIVGTCFKKSYFDPVKGHNCSELILPRDLVVDYWAKDMDTARVTHRYYMTDRNIKTRQLRGLFEDIDLAPVKADADQNKDKRQGTRSPDKQDGRLLLEQHTYLDLDDDGYSEPYIVTVDAHTKSCLRIVAGFSSFETSNDGEIKQLLSQLKELDANQSIAPMDKQRIAEQVAQEAEALKDSGEVIGIERDSYFTKYDFIPSPDGGFYGLGFGRLLGPVNDAVDTMLNQVIDAGTLANAGGGFIGRGVRMKGGQQRFQPGEWKRVDSTGTDLRQNIMPLPVPRPDGALINMLMLLINYGERVSSVTDLMVGENPGQNTPATTSMALLEQGMKVFSGIFKRVYRSMKREFRILYRMNRTYLNEREYFEVLDSRQPATVLRADYAGDEKDISPVADPNAISTQEKLAKVEALTQRAAAIPGYNIAGIERRFLAAAGIDNTQEIYPVDEQGNPVIQPQPDPMMQVEVLKAKAETETMYLNAEADIQLKKAQAVLALAKAQKEDASIDLEAAKNEVALLDTLLKEVQEKRKSDDRGRGEGMA